MRIRTAAALALSTAATAGPAQAAAAQWAMVETSYPCYASGESVLVTGTGFTPNGQVTVSVSGQELTTLGADSDGAFSLRMQAPAALFGVSRLRLTATDRTRPSLSDDAAVRIADMDVVVVPEIGGRRPLWRIRAWGFFDTAAVYAHVKRRGAARARNIRLATPRGSCGLVDVRHRLFPRAARFGSYALQFDSLRRYYPNLESSVTYRLDVLGP